MFVNSYAQYHILVLNYPPKSFKPITQEGSINQLQRNYYITYTNYAEGLSCNIAMICFTVHFYRSELEFWIIHTPEVTPGQTAHHSYMIKRFVLCCLYKVSRVTYQFLIPFMFIRSQKRLAFPVCLFIALNSV